MHAIIFTGGKQYLVSKGDVIRVEKLLGEEGSVVTFDRVLFAGDDTSAKIDAKGLGKTVVEGKIKGQGRAKKVTGIKHKAKKRYKVTFGHRQMFTEVEITKVA